MLLVAQYSSRISTSESSIVVTTPLEAEDSGVLSNLRARTCLARRHMFSFTPVETARVNRVITNSPTQINAGHKAQLPNGRVSRLPPKTEMTVAPHVLLSPTMILSMPFL